jgi:hypothetical protein
VKRRVDEQAGNAAPVHLARFDPADWPGSKLEALAAWKAARRVWVRAGNSWPGGPVALVRENKAVECLVLRRPLPPGMGPAGEVEARTAREVVVLEEATTAEDEQTLSDDPDEMSGT